MLWYMVIFSLSLCFPTNWCSGVEIKNNAYTGILVALPHNLEDEERARVVLNVEAMFRSSSNVLQLSTKGRAYFAEVSLLVPDTWNIPDFDPTWESISYNSSAVSEAGAAVTVDEADVVITEAGQFPYVLHQNGCGLRAKRIILPKDFLLGEGEKGLEFTRLWSEYRYGVFPEGGFRNDEKYPLTYSTPGRKEETVTGCSDHRFWISDDGREGTGNSTSSLMDQHQPTSAKLFCEGYVGFGPRHNPEPPSKHNLMCREEATWFTVMRNPDFARGKNAAPIRLPDSSAVSFRFFRESIAPKVVIAIETSSRMSKEFRFLLVKSPLYRFLYSTLPDASEVTLIFFGGDEGVKVEKHGVVLEDGVSKLRFIESQPLPEDVSETVNLSLDQLFEVIFQTIGDRNDSRAASADIIIITTASHANATAVADVKQRISESKSRLHVMLFEESETEESNGTSLYDLCHETGGHFTSLRADAFGDMHRGFGNVIRNSRREIRIMQDYLKENDDVDLEVPFVLDQSLAENLKVYLSFPFAATDDLKYRRTTLQVPSGGHLNFLKMRILDAWMIDLAKPEVGEYVLKTRRLKEDLFPVLITVTGSSSTSVDPITVNVWTETVPDSGATPTPVKIFVEVKKGWNPVARAQVIATIRHPDDVISQETLLDDGIGDVDITKDDGIYGSYFTKFTAPGYYNVYVRVTEGLDGTELLTGPDNLCCGSFFPASESHSIGSFQREAGPLTFHVPWFEVPSNEHGFSPSRVTDLRIGDLIDRICILHWTAVGDDYNTGFASTYELKVFRDPAVIRNRFTGSGQDIYSETIKATPNATYGTPLNHAFQLPTDINKGAYYIALRAVDSSGNAGEPSNTVPVWIEESSPKIIDCESEEETCENDECEEMPRAEKLQHNSAKILVSGLKTFGFISTNVFVTIMPLILSMGLQNPELRHLI